MGWVCTHLFLIVVPQTHISIYFTPVLDLSLSLVDMFPQRIFAADEWVCPRKFRLCRRTWKFSQNTHTKAHYWDIMCVLVLLHLSWTGYIYLIGPQSDTESLVHEELSLQLSCISNPSGCGCPSRSLGSWISVSSFIDWNDAHLSNKSEASNQPNCSLDRT